MQFTKKLAQLHYCCVKRKALNTKYVYVYMYIYIYASFFMMPFTKRDDADFFRNR